MSKTADLQPAPNSVPPSNDAAPALRGVFEPPQGLTLTAISRHRRLVALFAVLGAILGISYGLLTPTTYEAVATLQVGQVNPNSPGFYSYVQSSSSLATAFSRSIAAAPVLARVDRKLGLPPGQAGARLSSEPIPLSPAFRVIATGPNRKAAIRLANVAAASVIAYENHRNSAHAQSAALLSSYRKAALRLNRASERAGALGSGSSDERLAAAAELSAARVRLKAISTAYVAAVGSEPPRVGLVSLIAGATSASDDGGSKVQLYGIGGLLGGAILGCLAAVIGERRRRRPNLGSGGNGGESSGNGGGENLNGLKPRPQRA